MSLNNGQFIYDPYPVGLSQGVIEQNTYSELVNNFPNKSLFLSRGHYGNKLSLSETDNGDTFFKFIKETPVYRRFYDETKKPDFIKNVITYLNNHHIDLSTRYRKYMDLNKFHTLYPIRKTYLNLLNKLGTSHHLNTKFEFSMLPLDGGHILPHTDSPQKIITLVLSIVDENEIFDDQTGGGTCVMRPKDITKNYNELNKWSKFEDNEIIHTFPFNPNQCVIFVKTFNSLHAVEPMKLSGSNRYRKSITINIENVQKFYGSRTY